MRTWACATVGAVLLAAWTNAATAQETGAADPQQTEPRPPSGRGALYPTLTVASEYRYDGKSNSSGRPVVQASLYWRRPDETFAGVFASSVDFSGYNDPNTSFEIDIYAGRTWDFGGYDWYAGAHTRLSVQAMYTMFPDNETPGPTYDFLQLSTRVQRRLGGHLTFEGSASFTPQASYGAGRAWKWEADADYEVNSWLSIRGAAGLREVQRRPDYSFWNVGATATFRRTEFDLRYYDTDLTFVACSSSPNCGSAVVGKLSWNMW